MCREHARAERPRAKTLLCAYRVALTGVHLLRSGEVRGDVLENARDHGLNDVEELVAFKRDAGEKAPLPEDLDAKHRARWPKLEGMLDEAVATSPLPDEPANVDAIDAWLVERRIAALG